MTAARRFRPAHLLALVLIAPPVVKLAEWAWPSGGPRAVDARSVAAGRALFNHEWAVNDPMGSGDGLGPVFNARSCLECHSQGGGGGGGPVDKNVMVYGLSPTKAKGATIAPVGMVHASSITPSFNETLDMVDASLPRQKTIPVALLSNPCSGFTAPTGVSLTQRNTTALFGDGLLDAIPEDTLYAEQRRNSDLARLAGMSRAVDPKIRGRVARLPDGRIGRFGWKAEFATLDDFVRAACANELGLSNPTRKQPTSLARPLSTAASASTLAAKVDLTDAQCVLMGDYLRDLPAPVQVLPTSPAARERVANGAKQFEAIGCADCHTPNLGTITGFYSNLLLHDMGSDLASNVGYGEPIEPNRSRDEGPPEPGEWRTPPLWGVADSAPYLHDGRAETLEAAIASHRGEAVDVARRFEALPGPDRDDLIAFLKTLRAPNAANPAPMATASR